MASQTEVQLQEQLITEHLKKLNSAEKGFIPFVRHVWPDFVSGYHHKKIAKVGNEPAVTKQQQRIILNGSMILTDTPGMMWPKITNDIDGYFLAVCHTIGINAYDETETAIFLFNAIKDNYGDLIAKKYKIEKPFPKDEEFLQKLAKKRGFIVKGGHMDLYKAATTLLNDFR